jgi:hypothetical protein
MGLGVNVGVQFGVKVKVGCGVLKGVGVGVVTWTIKLPTEQPRLTPKPTRLKMTKNQNPLAER